MGFIGDFVGDILGAPEMPKWPKGIAERQQQMAEEIWGISKPVYEQQAQYAQQQMGVAQQMLPFLLQYAGQRLTGMPAPETGIPSALGSALDQAQGISTPMPELTTVEPSATATQITPELPQAPAQAQPTGRGAWINPNTGRPVWGRRTEEGSQPPTPQAAQRYGLINVPTGGGQPQAEARPAVPAQPTTPAPSQEALGVSPEAQFTRVEGPYSRTAELEAMARQRADLERFEQQATGQLQQNLAQRFGTSAGSPSAMAASLEELASNILGQRTQARVAETQRQRAEEGARLAQLAALVPGMQLQSQGVLAGMAQAPQLMQGAAQIGAQQYATAAQQQQNFMNQLAQLGAAIGGMGGNFPVAQTPNLEVFQYGSPGFNPNLPNPTAGPAYWYQSPGTPTYYT